MGHSQNIRDWFGDDFCWRAMARGDRFAAMALLGGIRCAHGDGNQFRHHHSCSYSRHALVQPLSWKDHGDDAIGFWIRGFFRCTADQPDPDGEWRKLAASVDDCGRDFRLVRNCRVSVCEGASGRSGPNGGRRAGCGAIGEGDGGNCTGDKISVGPPTGLRNTRVLDDTRRGGGLPIPVFFLYGPLAAPLERSRRASRRRRIRHGSLHAGGRVWPADWWLADGRHGGALRVHAGLLLLFLGDLPGDSRFTRSAVDRLQRRDSLRNRVRMDVYLPEYGHRSLLWTGGFSKGERNDAGARGPLLRAGRLPGREAI